MNTEELENVEDFEEAMYIGLSMAELAEAHERFGGQRKAALDLVATKGLRNMTMRELLDASSLGTPVARYMQAKCPPEVVEELSRMFDEQAG